LDVDRDGNCLPRSILIALGLPASDSDVAALRKSMANLMRKHPHFFGSWVLGKEFDTKSEVDAATFKASCDGVETWGTFCGDPETCAASQVLNVVIRVDTLRIKVH